MNKPDWKHWALMPYADAWQIAALAMDVDPDEPNVIDYDRFDREWLLVAQDEDLQKQFSNCIKAIKANFFTEKSIPVQKFLDFAVLKGMQISPDFAALSQKPQHMIAPARPPVSQPVTRHVLKARENLIDPVIDKAVSIAGSESTAAVFPILINLALAEEGPFSGQRDGDALLYTDKNNKPAKLTKDALGARLRRRKKAVNSNQ